MGLVFLGRDERLDRPVAVKVVLPSPDQAKHGLSDRAKADFLQEAKLGASLTHAAVVTVYDHGIHAGSPYTVFEYVEGEDLRAYLRRRGRLTLDEIRLILPVLALALDHAHSRQVVHGDLKPENIRVSTQGEFKILDLGLAKRFNLDHDWRFAGTPAYSSPEQAADQPSDGRTDQYSLALIVYEMLSGQRPFKEKRALKEVLNAHRNEPIPSILELVPDVPETVDVALSRALGKDPNDRFDSCTEFVRLLGCQLVLGDLPTPTALMEAEVSVWIDYDFDYDSLRRGWVKSWGTLFFFGPIGWVIWNSCRAAAHFIAHFVPRLLLLRKSYIALMPDSIYVASGNDVVQWSYSSLKSIRVEENRLQLDFVESDLVDRVFLCFSNRTIVDWILFRRLHSVAAQEAALWSDRIDQLRSRY